MIFAFYLWILFYLGLLAGFGLTVYRVARYLIGRDETHSRQLQGRRNQLRLKARSEEVCNLCHLATDPTTDPWDPKIGWYHERCYDSLTND